MFMIFAITLVYAHLPIILHVNNNKNIELANKRRTVRSLTSLKQTANLALIYP